MASTALTDINFQGEVFRDRMAGEFTNKVRLLSTGMLANATTALSNGIGISSGYTQSIPHWNTLSGAMTQITSGGTLTPDALGDYKDTAVYVEREKAIQAEQWLTFIANADPTEETAKQLGMYLAVELQRTGVQVLKGVFATALASTHSHNANSNISAQAVLKAKYKLGDSNKDLTDIVMHSAVEHDAVTEKLISYGGKTENNDAYSSGSTGDLMGMTPHSDDDLTATAGVYSSYLGAKSSMIYVYRPRTSAVYNNQNRFLISANGIVAEVELVRDSLTSGGQDIIVFRTSFLVHVPGVAWNSTGNPTDAALATGSNWTKKADNKLIRVAELKTTASA